MRGRKFRRQQRIGPYFADFVCQAARLVVEVDGDSHANQIDYDRRRTEFLTREGYRVIRFTNWDIMNNVDGALKRIDVELAPSPSHLAAPGGPLLLPQGERG